MTPPRDRQTCLKSIAIVRNLLSRICSQVLGANVDAGTYPRGNKWADKGDVYSTSGGVGVFQGGSVESVFVAIL